MIASASALKRLIVVLLLLIEIEGFIQSSPAFNARRWLVKSAVDVTDKSLTNLYSTNLNKSSPETRREWLVKLISCAGASAVASLNNENANAVVAATTLAQTSPNIINLPTGSVLCEPTVSSWYRGSRTIHILGTAHISEESAQIAGKLVREIQPQAVFVELDAKRVGRVMPASTTTQKFNPTASGSTASTSNNVMMPISSVAPTSEKPVVSAAVPTGFNPFDIREGIVRRAGGAIVGDSIRRLYQNLESKGFSAGEEFAIAIREGLNIDATIVLGDQDVNYTLQRLAVAISKTDIQKLLSPDSDFEKSIQDSLPSQLKDQIQQQDSSMDMDAKQLSLFIKTMKNKENVKIIMDNFKIQAPEIHNALVAERDLFMATGLDMLSNFDTTVAVMGLAHLDGVENNLQMKGWMPLPIKCQRR